MLSRVEDVCQPLVSMNTTLPYEVLFWQLFTTIPILSANAPLKEVKIYLRSSMAKQKLNSLCLTSNGLELSAKLMEHVTSVVDKFAPTKE
jgi:hypothetical protein